MKIDLKIVTIALGYVSFSRIKNEKSLILEKPCVK